MFIFGIEVDELKVLITVLLAILSVYIILAKSAVAVPPETPTVHKLTLEEEEELINEFTLKPLVSESDAKIALNLRPIPIMTGDKKVRTTVNHKPVIDFGTHDYLNFAGRDELQKVATETIHKYGVGACGPRGFYGTFQCHLDVEKAIIDMYHLDPAIYGSMLFPVGFTTVSSIIPAFVSRHDFIVVDSSASAPIQCGVAISKANYSTFENNNMEELERRLKEHHEQYDKTVEHRKKSFITRTKNGDSPYLPRRFIIVDGINPNTGAIAQLDKIIELAKKYYFRIILDESFSFGCVGKKGLGVMDYYNASFNDVTFVTASLEYAMGTIGGFAVGPLEAIEISETTALGYCFSASSPPYLVACAGESLRLLSEEPERVKKLKDNAVYMLESLRKVDTITINGKPEAQLIPITLKNGDRSAHYDLRDKLIDAGFLVPVAETTGEDLFYTPCDHLRIAVSSDHTTEMMDSLTAAIIDLTK